MTEIKFNWVEREGTWQLNYNDCRWFIISELVGGDTDFPFRVVADNSFFVEEVYMKTEFRTLQGAKCAVEGFILEQLK